MMRPIAWRSMLRLGLAGVLGYALIVALTTLGFVGWLDDANLYRGDWILKAKGLLVALVAGLLGGGLAAWIGGSRPMRHALAVVPFLVVDSVYVLFFFARTDPIWFDLVGALGLVAATVGGGFFFSSLRKRSGRSSRRGRVA